MNKRKKDLIIGLIVMIAFTIFSVTAIATTNKCWWETENPNIEFGYTQTEGYNNPDKGLDFVKQEGTKYYPITDYVSVKKVLLTNEYVGSYFNHDLNVTTIKVRPKKQNSISYNYDLALFNKNNCSLAYMKSVNGDNRAVEIYSYFIPVFSMEDRLVCLFGDCKIWHIPHVEWEKHSDTLKGWKKIVDDAGINTTSKEILDCIKSDCLNLTGRD